MGGKWEGGRETERESVGMGLRGVAFIAMLHILKSCEIKGSLFLFSLCFMHEYSCCLLSIILKYIKMITVLSACSNTHHRLLV